MILNIGKGDPSLGFQDFNVLIGEACSGVESLSMFLGLSLLFLVYEHKNLIWKRTLIVFFAGIVGTFFLNIIRVTTLIMIGAKYPELALGLFHSQAGWILFSSFMLLLIYITYGWIKKK